MYKVGYEQDKKRTYPMTFRLPETMVSDLKSEADHEKVSLNTLVNQVFDKHVAWDRYSSKLGLIPMTRAFIKETIEYLPDQKIKEIANNAGKEALKELVLIASGIFTLNSFVSVFNEWLRASLMTHRYEHDASGHHHYFIHHDLGDKWSLYLSELLRAISRDLGSYSPSIRVFEGGIAFSLRSKSAKRPKEAIRDSEAAFY
ncbi:MAG: hypothetical protein ACE5J2_07480 [Nitrososphaerales archaeon]